MSSHPEYSKGRRSVITTHASPAGKIAKIHSMATGNVTPSYNSADMTENKGRSRPAGSYRSTDNSGEPRTAVHEELRTNRDIAVLHIRFRPENANVRAYAVDADNSANTYTAAMVDVRESAGESDADRMEGASNYSGYSRSMDASHNDAIPVKIRTTRPYFSVNSVRAGIHGMAATDEPTNYAVRDDMSRGTNEADSSINSETASSNDRMHESTDGIRVDGGSNNNGRASGIHS